MKVGERHEDATEDNLIALKRPNGAGGWRDGWKDGYRERMKRER